MTAWYSIGERERELNSVHAANRADGTQWIVQVRVPSILSRSCNKQEATGGACSIGFLFVAPTRLQSCIKVSFPEEVVFVKHQFDKAHVVSPEMLLP